MKFKIINIFSLNLGHLKNPFSEGYAFTLNVELDNSDIIK